MHEDHLVGLKKDDKGYSGYSNPVNWCYGKIYMSHITHRLMLLRFPNLKEYMIPLEMDK